MAPTPTPSMRRDRHGRGLRGPVLHPVIPAWRTRAEKFDDMISVEVATYRRALGPEVDRFDFGVLEVPEADPAPWEDGIPQARYFPMTDAKVEGRIILYRRPILQAAKTRGHVSLLIHAIVTQQLANALGRSPEEIDYHNL